MDVWTKWTSDGIFYCKTSILTTLGTRMDLKAKPPIRAKIVTLDVLRENHVRRTLFGCVWTFPRPNEYLSTPIANGRPIHLVDGKGGWQGQMTGADNRGGWQGQTSRADPSTWLSTMAIFHGHPPKLWSPIAIDLKVQFKHVKPFWNMQVMF